MCVAVSRGEAAAAFAVASIISDRARNDMKGTATERDGVAVELAPPASAERPERVRVADEALDERIVDGDLHEAAKHRALVLRAGLVEALEAHVARGVGLHVGERGGEREHVRRLERELAQRAEEVLEDGRGGRERRERGGAQQCGGVGGHGRFGPGAVGLCGGLVEVFFVGLGFHGEHGALEGLFVGGGLGRLAVVLRGDRARASVATTG